MTLSGIYAVADPLQLPSLRRGLESVPWAQLHFVDADGRMVLTIEAADERQSADRLLELQGVAGIRMAQLAEVRTLDEPLE